MVSRALRSRQVEHGERNMELTAAESGSSTPPEPPEGLGSGDMRIMAADPSPQELSPTKGNEETEVFVTSTRQCREFEKSPRK
jgi:hypothetical protein